MGHEHKAQRTVVCPLVRRYEAFSFFQSLQVLAPYAALGCSVFCLYLRAYVLQQYSGLVIFPSTGVVCRLGLFCFVFVFCFTSVRFASLPIFHLFVLAPILFRLAMGSGAGDAVPCRFGVGLSVFTFVPELVSRPI